MRSPLMAGVAAVAIVFATLIVSGIGPAPATVGAVPARPAVATSVCTGVLLARFDGSISVQAPKGQTCASSIAQGSLAGTKLNAPIIGSAALPNGNGYWLLGLDGGVFAFGQAQFYGSTGGMHINAPVVGMASTPDGGGYWLVASDGGIFSFGDAQFFGSAGGTHLDKPVVGMAADGATGGYWLVASDGGVFSYHAPFFGSMGGQPLNAPMRFMTGTPDFGGYRLVALDGGVFDYGDAQFFGSAAAPGSFGWSALATTPDNGGYWLFAATGLSAVPTYKAFGDASNDLTFVGGDALSTAFVVGASTVSFLVPLPPPPSAGGIFNAVSCASTTVCVVVGGTSGGGALIERSTDGGSTFTADTLPAGSPALEGIDCETSLDCVAIGTTSTGSASMVSDDGGVTWSLHTTAVPNLAAVSCENQADCTAVGGGTSASAAYSSNGGATWTASATPPSSAYSVTCEPSKCIASGASPFVSTDGGNTWAPEAVSGGAGPYLSASCTPSASDCLAIGPNPGASGNPALKGELARSTDGGTTWSDASAALPGSTGTAEDVSCWTATDCMVLGWDQATGQPATIFDTVTPDGGSTFGGLHAPGANSVALNTPSTMPAPGFTCAPSGNCLVVAANAAGAIVYFSTDQGATWTLATVQ